MLLRQNKYIILHWTVLLTSIAKVAKFWQKRHIKQKKKRWHKTIKFQVHKWQ